MVTESLPQAVLNLKKRLWQMLCPKGDYSMPSTTGGNPQTTKDLKGKEVVLGDLPGVGTRLVIAGNKFRIGYVKHGAGGAFRFSADLTNRHQPETLKDE